MACLVECGTLSGAAEKLHLSQPSLSRAMQRLETELHVSLFIRHKNRIELNSNGEMAVEYARKILGEANDMVTHIQAFDRSQRTILAGSSAPAPLWEILPVLGRLYPDMTISSELRESEALLQGLRSGTYKLIILPYAVQEDGISYVRYGEEHLFFSLPPAHPLSGSKGLYLKDLNGEAMLLLDRLHFWVQEDNAFSELVNASALPCFTTDRVLTQGAPNQNRINVPILDPEANVTYYCLYQTANRKLLGDFLNTIQN